MQQGRNQFTTECGRTQTDRTPFKKEEYRIPHVATEQAAFQSPAYLIEPVDGTGSGDAFHTGMIYGFLRGWDMRETAQFANACGDVR